MTTRYTSSTWITSDDIQELPVGSRATIGAEEVPGSVNSAFYGDLEVLYIFNDSTALVLGDLVITDVDYAKYDGIVSGTAAVPSNRVLGACIGPIEAGEWGWVATKGVCYVKDDGGILQGESIVSHTSGQVDTMASGEEEAIIGIALANGAGAGLVTLAYLNL